MIKVMFVCLGNICRSHMAEFVFRDMVQKAGLSDKIYIASSATSRWEIGNPVHSGTRNRLKKEGIDTSGKVAVQLTKADFTEYDLLIGMESSNISDMLKISGGANSEKVHKLLDFADGGNIADPWYTGDFDATYNDVIKGCTGLLEHLKEKYNL
ncbi:MAG: low molecular weight phosphotyrosine protein phosphatase [Clostridia bacterium]|nr:low molecular weight phosphotyrosine protein phosphatase [Clostridia bacterium]